MNSFTAYGSVLHLHCQGDQPKKGQGACSVSDANDWPLPWTTGVTIPAAISYTQ